MPAKSEFLKTAGAKATEKRLAQVGKKPAPQPAQAPVPQR